MTVTFKSLFSADSVTEAKSKLVLPAPDPWNMVQSQIIPLKSRDDSGG